MTKIKAAYMRAYRKKNAKKLAAKQKMYYRRNAKRLKAWQRVYAKKNAKKIAAKQREYRRKNAERRAATNKAWRKKNAKKLAAKWRAYHRKNLKRINARQRRYYRANVSRIAMDIHRSRMFRTYGLTVAQRDRLNGRLGLRCFLCFEPERRGSKRLSVDHNHDTGDVRGLLCHRCNWVLDHALSTAVLSRRAKAYLTRQTGFTIPRSSPLWKATFRKAA